MKHSRAYTCGWVDLAPDCSQYKNVNYYNDGPTCWMCIHFNDDLMIWRCVLPYKEQLRKRRIAARDPKQMKLLKK